MAQLKSGKIYTFEEVLEQVNLAKEKQAKEKNATMCPHCKKFHNIDEGTKLYIQQQTAKDIDDFYKEFKFICIWLLVLWIFCFINLAMILNIYFRLKGMQ